MNVREISILDYLQKKGIEVKKEGRLHLCSSPFSKDSTWSFIIYPTNTFYDWSTGIGGSIIQLHSRMESLTTKEAYNDLKTKENYGKATPKTYKKRVFKLERYITKQHEEVGAIERYAQTRRITEGYLPAVFNEKKDGSWKRVLALGFLHVDKDLKPCGIKLRRITKEEPRFSARGQLGFYVHSCTYQIKKDWQLQSPTLYIVEGEGNANSLMAFMKEKMICSVVLSIGSVAKTMNLDQLPLPLQAIPKKLIIDYDGDEELYQQRLKAYEKLGAEPIKLILPKGDDLNSLYCKDKMYLIENLL